MTRQPGNEVRFGSRTPETAGDLPAPAGTREDVIAWGEIVVLAVPGAAAEGVVGDIGGRLAGKIMIDASNRAAAVHLHSIDAILAAAPDALPSRAFDTVGREVMADPTFGAERAELFFCGPEAARKQVAALIAGIRFRQIWVDDTDPADVVDVEARLWMTRAMKRGLGPHLALGLLTD